MVDIPPARTGSGFSASPLRRVPPLHTAAGRAVDTDAEIARMSAPELLDGIAVLRADRNAVILAHNYQIPAIQDLADFVGDSLQLSQQAATTDAGLIVFCGVHFMAETAAILCPAKRVLIPDPEASCSLAESVTADRVRAWKAEHPGATVVAYVNTDAAVKAEVDYCCTSSNARQVIDSIPMEQEILFLPDRFLGLYLQSVTGRRLHLWPGECHVHAAIGPADVDALFARHPGADLLLHPECGCVSQCLWRLAEGDLPAERTFVLSTGGMVAHARNCPRPVDLVGTETGMLHRLRQVNPAKTFVPLREDAVCSYMKTITVPKLYRALRDDVYPVTVPDPVARRARRAIDRMLSSV
jgi:quinolinate synthase